MLGYGALGEFALGEVSKAASAPPDSPVVSPSMTVNFDGGTGRVDFGGGTNRVNFDGGTNRVNF